jgi:hypothetical protein
MSCRIQICENAFDRRKTPASNCLSASLRAIDSDMTLARREAIVEVLMGEISVCLKNSRPNKKIERDRDPIRSDHAPGGISATSE